MLIGWYRIPESTREPLELVVNPHGLQERSQVRQCVPCMHRACPQAHPAPLWVDLPICLRPACPPKPSVQPQPLVYRSRWCGTLGMAAASSLQWPRERRYRCRCGRARTRPAAPGKPAARAPPAARAAPWGRRQRRARSAPQAALREAACRSQGKWATDAAAPAGSARRGGAGKQQVRPPSLPPVGRRMVWLCTPDLYVKNTAMHNACDRTITMPVIEQCCST